MNNSPPWIKPFFIIAFIAFLFAGLQMGKAIFAPHDPVPVLQGEASLPLPNPEDNFLLVIQVDNMHTEEIYLEGVWLITFQTQEPSLSFLPLLPSQADNAMERDKKLASAFALDDKNQPAPEFFKILSERNISWQGYIIIDQWSITEIISFLGGVDLGSGLKSGIEIIDELHTRSQDRLLAQRDQALLLQAACLRGAKTSQEISFSQVLTALPSHFAMGGISPSTWETEWRAMKEIGNISCTTPTLPDLTVK